MKNPFNTLFGRLSLMTVSLIVLVHITAVVLVDSERGQLDTGHAQRALLLALEAEPGRPLAASQVSETLGVTYVKGDDAIVELFRALRQHVRSVRKRFAREVAGRQSCSGRIRPTARSGFSMRGIQAG